MDYIRREIYLNKLIARRNNGEVKVITGPRRSGSLGCYRMCITII